MEPALVHQACCCFKMHICSSHARAVLGICANCLMQRGTKLPDVCDACCCACLAEECTAAVCLHTVLPTAAAQQGSEHTVKQAMTLHIQPHFTRSTRHTEEPCERHLRTACSLLASVKWCRPHALHAAIAHQDPQLPCVLCVTSARLCSQHLYMCVARAQ